MSSSLQIEDRCVPALSNNTLTFDLCPHTHTHSLPSHRLAQIPPRSHFSFTPPPRSDGDPCECVRPAVCSAVGFLSITLIQQNISQEYSRRDRRKVLICGGTTFVMDKA